MKTSRFKPLENSQQFDFNNVTPVTREKQHCVTDKYEENHKVKPIVTPVTPVTRINHDWLSEYDTHPAGEGIASGDNFRAIEYHDISYEEAGMVQCYRCRYTQSLGRSEPSGCRVGRCRHPSLHGGRWVTLDGEMWRRCVGFSG